MIVKFTKSPFRGKESLYEMKKYLSHLSCTIEVQSVPVGVVRPLARDLRGLRGEGCGWLGSWLGHGLGNGHGNSQTCNSSRMHGYYPCKILSFLGKFLL